MAHSCDDRRNGLCVTDDQHSLIGKIETQKVKQPCHVSDRKFRPINTQRLSDYPSGFAGPSGIGCDDMINL